MNTDKIWRLQSWQAGKHPGPWRVVVFPTHRCNLKCTCCPHSWLEDPPEMRPELPDNRWLELVDEGAELGVQEWLFAGGGEPMLRGQLVLRMCQRIRELGMNGIIQTNGTQFSSEQLQQLVEMEWGFIHFSIDGPTAEMHDAIRSPGVFGKVTGNIRQLAALRRNTNKTGTDSECNSNRFTKRKPVISITSLITALNYDKMDQMVTLAHDLEADILEFTELIVFDHEKMSDIILTRPQKATLPAHAERAISRANELGIAISLPDFIRHIDKRSDEQQTNRSTNQTIPQKFSEVKCFEPWLSTVIWANGMVGPCCIFWDHVADSLRDKSLAEAWLGPYLSRVRTEMSQGRLQWGCAQCPETVQLQQQESGTELAKIEETLEHFALNPSNLLPRLLHSLQNNGIQSTFVRLREWFQVRHELNEKIPPHDHK